LSHYFLPFVIKWRRYVRFNSILRLQITFVKVKRLKESGSAVLFM